MASQDIDIERARIECVFGLGGGELHVADERFPDEWDDVIAFWFESAPDYPTDLKETNEVTCTTCQGSRVDPADGDCDCPSCDGMGKHDLEIRTAILCGVYGLPEAPAGWTQVASYSSSGEAACWWCADGDDDHEDGDGVGKGCKLCEGDGYVCLGDGWCEVVYRRVAGA